MSKDVIFISSINSIDQDSHQKYRQYAGTPVPIPFSKGFLLFILGSSTHFSDLKTEEILKYRRYHYLQ